MAITTYRYKLIGPTEDMLGDLVPGVKVVKSVVSCDTMDLSVDDSLKADLDEAMADYGYAPTVYDPSTPPTYGIQSDDGSIWNFSCDNKGTLTMKKQKDDKVQGKDK
jgi:hypothetical protein